MSHLPSDTTQNYDGFRHSIVTLLEASRHAVVRQINALMTASYWEVGRRIVEFEQSGQERATYGEELIKRLGSDLSQQFGRGFGWCNLTQMRAFYLMWPTPKILQTVSAKSPLLETAQKLSLDLPTLTQAFPLPWSAYVRLLSIKNPQARTFYETEALRNGWSVRQLDRQIGSQFYERTALSHNKAAMLQKGALAVPEDMLSPEQAIKDPFVLEFLNLKDDYSESDLEDALIQHLADFLLELGDDFAFVGRQRRLRIDDNWFRVDLLFFHRRLKCLLVIDLKVGKFSYADAGQMHLYLNYAREHWTKPGENPPVGLILCAEKGAAEAHYALEGLPNKVLAAEYQTVLPDEKLLAEELDKTRRVLEAQNSLREGEKDDEGRLAETLGQELNRIRAIKDRPARDRERAAYAKGAGSTATNLEALVSCYEELKKLDALDQILNISGNDRRTFKDVFRHMKFGNTNSFSVYHGGARFKRPYGKGFLLEFFDKLENKPVTLYIAPALFEKYRPGARLRRIVDDLIANEDRNPYLTVYWIGGLEENEHGYSAKVASLAHLALRLVYSSKKSSETENHLSSDIAA